MAAIHEAGHVTMARNVGLDILAAWLEKTPDPGVYDKLWIGHTRPYLKKKMSREKLAMFAVAGAVAECCWHRDSFDEMLDNDAWYDAAAMSDSDWACCRCEPGNPTPRLLKIIKTVFSLFDRQAGKLWPDLLVEARRLIEHSRNPHISLECRLRTSECVGDFGLTWLIAALWPFAALPTIKP